MENTNFIQTFDSDIKNSKRITSALELLSTGKAKVISVTQLPVILKSDEDRLFKDNIILQDKYNYYLIDSITHNSSNAQVSLNLTPLKAHSTTIIINLGD